MAWVLLGLVVGGGYGAYRAKTVEMTKMPELVAFFHSMIGLAEKFKLSIKKIMMNQGIKCN